MEMKAAAVIAEYNPFHNGHEYHLRRTRELGATHIAVIMSGECVQRGEFACLPKWTRAEAALRCGADLVIELPAPWSMAGAEKFALGGVSLANALGCVSMLSFGSECGGIDTIKRVAELPDTDAFREALRPHLDTGMTFAAARQLACEELLPEAAGILRSPNDALAVEYCRAIRRLGADIEPVCVRREGAEHDGEAEGGFASASFLRQRLENGESLDGYVPAPALDIPMRGFSHSVSAERLDLAVRLILHNMTAEDIAALPDVSEGLENRIVSCAKTARSFAELCDAVKSKRYTHARIRRILMSALVRLKAEDGEGTPPYIRVLGMNTRGKELLADAKPSLPVITRYADAKRLDGHARHIFDLCTHADETYHICADIPSTPDASDAAHGVIVLP